MIYRSFFGLLFFFVFYRLDLAGTGITMNLILGMMFLIFLKKDNMRFKKSDRNLIFLLSVLLLFSVFIDLYLVKEINTINSYFSVRIISVFILTYCSAEFFKKYFIKSRNDLLFLMRFAVLLQLFFFCLLYLMPEYKPVVYGLFGASDSVNLLDWNKTSRGFGIGAEINYTGPVITAIIAFISFRSFFMKAFVALSQIANANTTIIAVLYFLNKGHFKRISLLVIILSSIFYGLGLDLGLILPRLDQEMQSGFTMTIMYLISDHFIILNKSYVDYCFGVPIMIMPGANKYFSSDSGWIIMLNYGGLLFITLFVALLVILITRLKSSLWLKMFLLFVGLLLNFKGLVLGPNAYFFILFLLSGMSIPYGVTRTFN
jgi:hypothetical protein